MRDALDVAPIAHCVRFGGGGALEIKATEREEVDSEIARDSFSEATLHLEEGRG